MTTIVSDRFRGVLGSAAALSGLLVMPLIILLVLATIYDSFADLPERLVHHASHVALVVFVRAKYVEIFQRDQAVEPAMP